MLDIGKGLEFFDIELGAVKALLDVFRISVGVDKQILQLNQVVLLAFVGVENFATTIDTFCAVFACHALKFPP